MRGRFGCRPPAAATRLHYQAVWNNYLDEFNPYDKKISTEPRGSTRIQNRPERWREVQGKQSDRACGNNRRGLIISTFDNCAPARELKGYMIG